MTVYVAEIAGRAIFAFDAPDADAAKARLTDREYLGDLYVFQNDGHSLWDGRSAIEMREAVAEETEVWAAEHQSAKLSRVFLIPVADPLKFADAEDFDAYDELDDDDDFDDDRD